MRPGQGIKPSHFIVCARVSRRGPGYPSHTGGRPGRGGLQHSSGQRKGRFRLSAPFLAGPGRMGHGGSRGAGHLARAHLHARAGRTRRVRVRPDSPSQAQSVEWHAFSPGPHTLTRTLTAHSRARAQARACKRARTHIHARTHARTHRIPYPHPTPHLILEPHTHTPATAGGGGHS
jgi:hypothetical protein